MCEKKRPSNDVRTESRIENERKKVLCGKQKITCGHTVPYPRAREYTGSWLRASGEQRSPFPLTGHAPWMPQRNAPNLLRLQGGGSQTQPMTSVGAEVAVVIQAAPVAAESYPLVLPLLLLLPPLLLVSSRSSMMVAR